MLRALGALCRSLGPFLSPFLDRFLEAWRTNRRRSLFLLSFWSLSRRSAAAGRGVPKQAVRQCCRTLRVMFGIRFFSSAERRLCRSSQASW